MDSRAVAAMSRMQRQILRWEKPPVARDEYRRGSRDTQWDEVAAQLREMSGVWAVIYEGPMARMVTVVGSIRAGRNRCWAPAGAYEAQQVGLGGREVTVYARYVGEEADEPRTEVVVWDWREQPDHDQLAAAISRISAGAVHAVFPDTGSSDYALVLSSLPLTPEAAARLYHDQEGS